MIRKIFIALALLIGTLMSLEDQVSAALITNEPSGSWTSMSMTGAPPFQFGITAVSVGNKLIVLGLKDDTSFENTGGIYEFVTKIGPKAMPWIPLLLLGD